MNKTQKSYVDFSLSTMNNLQNEYVHCRQKTVRWML